MVYGSVITKNSDGSYTSSAGHEVTSGWGGNLYVGGAPTGLRDYGSSVGLSSAKPTPFFGAGVGASYAPGTPGVVTHYSGRLSTYAQSDIGLSGLIVYPWMFCLACFCALAISGSPPHFKGGLHHHPIYGVTAFFMTFWLYRQLMTFWLTAGVLTVLSAFAAALMAWDINNQQSLHRIIDKMAPKFSGPLMQQWDGVRHVLIPALDGWTIAIFLLILASHAAYWKHRRKKARIVGWLLTKSLRTTGHELLTIALSSVAFGWLIARIW
jgi:hypothetical protein